MAHGRGLLLDIGGVVVKAGAIMVARLAESEPELKRLLDSVGGGLATARDELWQQVLRHEIGEQAYWAQRATELGAAVGRRWDTRALMKRLYGGPEQEWLNQGTIDLMRDAKAAGLPVGALTNDLGDFHGKGWVSAQRWLDLFDVIVDASDTGVMTPDPRAFAAGVEALGLAPGEIVYLDDMPWNVAGGIAAGLQTVPVSPTEPEIAVGQARRRLGLAALTRSS
jgi:putative hydrolase of the HAD superfamily